MLSLPSPRLFLVPGLSLLLVCDVTAQVPTSVDIDLRQSTMDANNLEVFIRANDSLFENVFSGLTFTVRWATTSTATLGTRVNACPAGIPIAPTALVSDPVVDGSPNGFDYITYNAFGLSSLIDEGCPLPQDEWMLVMTVPVQNNTGCTEFQIVNDAFTDSPGNARDYYLSLGGLDRTGIIEPTAVFIGNCAPDCLGMPGGTALPGTPCDDGDPGSVNDVYSPECLCIGSVAVQELSLSSAVFGLSPNPTIGPVRLIVNLHITNARLRIFDALGRPVLSAGNRDLSAGGSWTLDLSGQPSGVYLIELISDGQRWVERLVLR